MNAYEKTLNMLIERLGDAQLELTRASNAYQKHTKFAVLHDLFAATTYTFGRWHDDLLVLNDKLEKAEAEFQRAHDAYEKAKSFGDDKVDSNDIILCKINTDRYRVLKREAYGVIGYSIWDDEVMNFISFPSEHMAPILISKNAELVQDYCDKMNEEDKS